MITKTCFKCAQTKPIDDFYRHPQTADGHLNKCKVCTRYDVAVNRDKRQEYYLSYDRQRFHTSSERRASTYAQAKNRDKNKDRTRKASRHAVITGKIERKPCEMCGSTERLEMHHTDYTKPLEVTWLCTICHGKAHRKPRIAPY